MGSTSRKSASVSGSRKRNARRIVAVGCLAVAVAGSTIAEPVGAAAKKSAAAKAASSVPSGRYPQCVNVGSWLLNRLLVENITLSLNPTVHLDLGLLGLREEFRPARAKEMLDTIVKVNLVTMAQPLADALYLIELAEFLDKEPLRATANPREERFAIGDESPREINVDAPTTVAPLSVDSCLRMTSNASPPSIGNVEMNWEITKGSHLISAPNGPNGRAGVTPLLLHTGRETEEAAMGDVDEEPAEVTGTYDAPLLKAVLLSRLTVTAARTRAAFLNASGSSTAALFWERAVPEIATMEDDARRAVDGIELRAKAEMFISYHVPKSKKKTTKPTKPPVKPKPRKGPQAGVGDPHFLSIDGGNLEYQGAGEYDLVVSSAKDLRIQVRLEPMATNANVSVITAIGVRVDGHRVAVTARPTLRVTLDGKVITASRSPVAIDGDSVDVAWKDGSQLAIVTAGGNSLDEHFTPSNARFGKLAGLGGDWDAKSGNDYRTRAGKVIDIKDPKAVYDAFGASWRIAQKDSLFDYQPGQSTATFTLPGVPADRDPFKTSVTSDALEAARATCTAAGVDNIRLLIACAYDVAMTSDPSFADRAADMSRRLAALTPPTVTVDSTPTVGFGTPAKIVVRGTAWQVTASSPVVDITDQQDDGPVTEGNRLVAVGLTLVNSGRTPASFPSVAFESPFFTVPSSTDNVLPDVGGSRAGVDDCLRAERPNTAPGAILRCSVVVTVPASTKFDTVTMTFVVDGGDRVRLKLR